MNTFNHFSQLADAFEVAVDQTIRKVAFDIQAGAQDAAPVDTGFLKNSIYVETSDSSDYGQGGSAPKGAYLLPQEEKPDDTHTAIIGVGANYGIFIEFGTRFQPPRPYLMPAAEAARPGFEAAISSIEDRMRQVV